MILQNMVLPKTQNIAEGLYMKSKMPCNGFPLELRPGESISFAAYFNYFSLTKWREYTIVEDLAVFLNCEGRFKVAIDHHVLENGSENVRTIFSFESDDNPNVKLPLLPGEGLLSINITSLSDGSVLYGCGFCSVSEPPNNIRIGVDICTYRRESDIIGKAELICSFLRSSDNLFSDSVELYIIDNGNTLGDSLNFNKVHVIPNRNLGGSGGFARGMMEISDSGRFTHILLNDDDAVFDPESLYRTWAFLSFLKEEYKDAHIGGAMLMSECPSIVHESGAMYSERGRILHPVKGGLDLSNSIDCLRFDVEEPINYFGWWYLVMPVSHVQRSGYPLPLFIKWDDIEYGIRGRDQAMITLNGISVWHDSFKGKFSTSNNYSYYFARNFLVIGSTTDCLKRRDVLWMLRNAVFEAVCYRYECADMMISGIEDFLKGPEFVFRQCNEGMVPSIPISIGKTEDLRKDTAFEDPGSMEKKDIRIRILSMNGLLLPRKRNVETSPDDMDSSDFYRAGKVLYNIDGANGFVAERSFKRTVKTMLRTIGPAIKAILCFGRLKRRYEMSLSEYSSEEHWRSVFDPGSDE